MSVLSVPVSVKEDEPDAHNYIIIIIIIIIIKGHL